MLLALAAYFGGLLTIVSPCVLPVLPFVLTRTGQPFLRSGFPLLIGMAVTFTVIACLAAVGGNLAVTANSWGRGIALVALALFGAALLFPAIADRLTRPLVALGGRFAQNGSDGPLSSLLLGAATGLLWAPCAGPILGLLFTGAAIQGPTAATALLLLAYAAGSGTALAVVMVAGNGVIRRLRGTFAAGEWVRRSVGALVLAGVVAIAAGLDTGLLARLSGPSTNALEQAVLDRLRPSQPTAEPGATPLASLAGPGDWLNSPPLTAEQLRGRVVLVDFWTYSCINCLRTLPYVRAWDAKYRPYGLVVLGIHAPEFAFERNIDNVRTAVETFGIRYPVVTDNAYRVWRAFNNQYWPAHYFIDAMGTVRSSQFGEGDYENSERTIQNLLREAGVKDVPADLVNPARDGVQAPDSAADRTAETYLGYGRAEGFASPEGFQPDTPADYSAPKMLPANRWALAGDWTVKRERAEAAGPGRIQFRFHGRDLHLVLGSATGAPVRFRVRLDGEPVGADRGGDTDIQGFGTVDKERLYQLVRQNQPRERLFEIEFLDPGALAYAFTFG